VSFDTVVQLPQGVTQELFAGGFRQQK
jgi:hypothetical protein